MKNRINHSGFTMMEVVAVLVIMVIVTAVAVSRFASNQSNLVAATDTLTSHLRLAQARAMNMSTDTDSVWGIRFISTTQYHLFYCSTASTCDPGNAANQMVFLGAGSPVINITRVQVTNGAMIIAFDRFGTPYTNATLAKASILTSVLVLNLKDNNGNTISINITPQTGMITTS